MPKDIGYLKDYLREYENQAIALRKKKIKEQVSRNLGTFKQKPSKPFGNSFRGFMGSTIRFGSNQKRKKKEER